MRRRIISAQRDSLMLATRFAWLQNDIRKLQDQLSELTNAESSSSTKKSAELVAEMKVAQDLTNAESSGSTRKSAELAAEMQVAQVTARSEQIAEDSIHDSAYVMVEGAQEDVHEHI